MELWPYVESIRNQLVVAAEAGGDEARAMAERLAAPLDAAVRLALQDVLAAAAEEITLELAPGSVELRLRGRDPEFVVTPPVVRSAGAVELDTPADLSPPDDSLAQEGEAIARINLRMSERLKSRIEEAAAREGRSVNAWLVRAAAAVLERSGDRPGPRVPQGPQRYSGWAR